jgi:hypothetical protein
MASSEALPSGFFSESRSPPTTATPSSSAVPNPIITSLRLGASSAFSDHLVGGGDDGVPMCIVAILVAIASFIWDGVLSHSDDSPAPDVELDEMGSRSQLLVPLMLRWMCICRHESCFRLWSKGLAH